MKFYKLKVLSLERKLPLLKAPSGIYIAGFNPVGDMELLIKAGKDLSNKVKQNGIKCDVILTTELKGLPIAQEVAKNLNSDYVCLRKDKKCYMLNPKQISGESITSGKSSYYVSEIELEKLKHKNVVFVDDVFSTGSTFDHMLKFAEQEDFKIVAGLSILREGKAPATELNFKYKNTQVYCSGFLPLPEVSDVDLDDEEQEL